MHTDDPIYFAAPWLSLPPTCGRSAEITRHGSFSRAAEALHLSQPAVSLHMRLLEDDLGTALLERVGKRAFPTPAGRSCSTTRRAPSPSSRPRRTALHGLRGGVSGAVHLGTGATASIHMCRRCSGACRARYPGVELIVVTGNSVDIAAAVVANGLDVAVVTLPVTSRDLTVRPSASIPSSPSRRPARRWPAAGR